MVLYIAPFTEYSLNKILQQHEKNKQMVEGCVYGYQPLHTVYHSDTSPGIRYSAEE